VIGAHAAPPPAGVTVTVGLFTSAVLSSPWATLMRTELICAFAGTSDAGVDPKPLKVMVCVWGFTGDTQKAKSRFERTPPDRLSTSLAEAVEHGDKLVGHRPETQVLVA